MDGDEPRIPPLPRPEWTDAAREVFAFWGEPGAWENGSKTNIVMTLAQHPALAMAYNTFGKHLLLESKLSPRAKELAVLRVCWRYKSGYEWHYHVGYAVNLGMSLEELGAIREGSDAAIWAEADAAVLRLVDQLCDGGAVADETWAVLTRHFSRHDLMDLVFTIGHYAMLSWACAAFGIQIEPERDVIGFDLKTASGGTPTPFLKPGENGKWTSNAG